MNVTFILSVLFIHWIADFVCQSHEQSIKKSTSMIALIEHTFTYTCIWAVFILGYGTYNLLSLDLLWFLPITFCTHTITDYYTSRVNKMLWIDAEKSKNAHNFFVSIGFDQWLHYAQLFITLKWLIEA